MVKYQIIQLLKEVGREKTMMVITHDFQVAKEICGRIGILYLGEFVEISPAKKLFERQLHPYAEGFFDRCLKMEWCLSAACGISD